MRFGKFTITDFMVSGETAVIAFKNAAMLSGGGASLRYTVKDGVIEYLEAVDMFRS